MDKVSRRSLVTKVLPAAALGVALSATAKAEDQPHMREALEHLRKALRELEDATADKGGHRTRALNLTRQAINQVEAGIKFDNRHR
ncbi:MAG: hypothetical protein AB1757_09100 [Acidobacteriota bacterium]